MHTHQPHPAVATPVSETSDQRQKRLVSLYLNRIDHLCQSFRFARLMDGARLGFNDSLSAGAQSLNPRAKKKPPRKLVNIELELLINARAAELAKERGSNSAKLNQTDVNAASREVIAKFSPRRGRPADPLLAYHVQALMALHRQTCGEKLRAGITRNGTYDPHIKSPIQDAFVKLFQSIDPSVTLSALANIIVKAERSKAVEGKQFSHFFPFHGGSIDSATGQLIPGPGFRLERFVRIAPIYSS